MAEKFIFTKYDNEELISTIKETLRTEFAEILAI